MTITLDQLGPRARAHVEQQRAEQLARAERERQAAMTDAERTALEKVEQAECVKRFTGFGAKVYNLSQARRTKQTPGLPDLWVVFAARGLAFWWETKRQQGGRHSEAQLEFAAECRATGTPYHTGDRRDAEQFLIDLGIAYRDVHHVLEPVR